MLFFKRKERKGERFLFQFKRGKANETERLGRGILDRIAKVQRVFSVLISAAVNVHEEYGLSCSFRRGFTSEAINRGVTDSVVDRNNRLRKEERDSARKEKLKMRDHYSEVLVSLESYLKYSQLYDFRRKFWSTPI